MMNAGEIVGLVVGVVAILAALWRLTRGTYRIVRLGETALERLTAVEKELKPNGGGSLRDVANEIHGVALENKATSARIERKADDAVIGAGQAAMVASTTAQKLEELREETRQRHAENLRRFADLENNDKDHEILRELLLMQLKDKHGIDLLGDEDDPDDPPPLHVA